MTSGHNDWPCYKLNELGFVGRGRSRHRPRNDPSLYGGSIPFFQTGDIKAANLYLTEYSQAYSEMGLAQSKLWKPGTLCITIAANIAETAILGMPGCFPDSVVGFIPDPEIAEVRFMKYQFDTLRLLMQNVSQGTTQGNLSLDKLLTFDFRVPPLPIQRRVAESLGAYDDLIENNARRSRLLEQMARLLYRDWFGINDGSFTNSSSPVQSVMRTPYWCFVAESVDSYEGVKRYLATADIDRLEIVGGSECTYEDRPSRAQKQAVVDSVWFARMKETYKIAWFSDANSEIAESTLLSSGFAGFRAMTPKHWPYLFLTVSSLAFHAQKDRYCTGATQMSLTNEGLTRILVPVPAEPRVLAFGDLALPLLNQILVLQRANTVLRRTRDLLLPRFFSGEQDLNDE